MSHEHRQHPERFYDDEGEAYDGEEGCSLWLILGPGNAPGTSVTAERHYTHTFSPQVPRPMTRRQTYAHYRHDGGWRRWDALLMALLSEDERPESYGCRPTFTVERTDR